MTVYVDWSLEIRVGLNLRHPKTQKGLISANLALSKYSNKGIGLISNFIFINKRPNLSLSNQG